MQTQEPWRQSLLKQRSSLRRQSVESSAQQQEPWRQRLSQQRHSLSRQSQVASDLGENAATINTNSANNSNADIQRTALAPADTSEVDHSAQKGAEEAAAATEVSAAETPADAAAEVPADAAVDAPADAAAEAPADAAAEAPADAAGTEVAAAAPAQPASSGFFSGTVGAISSLVPPVLTGETASEEQPQEPEEDPWVNFAPGACMQSDVGLQGLDDGALAQINSYRTAQAAYSNLTELHGLGLLGVPEKGAQEAFLYCFQVAQTPVGKSKTSLKYAALTLDILYLYPFVEAIQFWGLEHLLAVFRNLRNDPLVIRLRPNLLTTASAALYNCPGVDLRFKALEAIAEFRSPQAPLPDPILDAALAHIQKVQLEKKDVIICLRLASEPFTHSSEQRQASLFIFTLTQLESMKTHADVCLPGLSSLSGLYKSAVVQHQRRIEKRPKPGMLGQTAGYAMAGLASATATTTAAAAAAAATATSTVTATAAAATSPTTAAEADDSVPESHANDPPATGTALQKGAADKDVDPSAANTAPQNPPDNSKVGGKRPWWETEVPVDGSDVDLVVGILDCFHSDARIQEAGLEALECRAEIYKICAERASPPAWIEGLRIVKMIADSSLRMDARLMCRCLNFLVAAAENGYMSRVAVMKMIANVARTHCSLSAVVQTALDVGLAMVRHVVEQGIRLQIVEEDLATLLQAAIGHTGRPIETALELASGVQQLQPLALIRTKAVLLPMTFICTLEYVEQIVLLCSAARLFGTLAYASSEVRALGVEMHVPSWLLWHLQNLSQNAELAAELLRSLGACLPWQADEEDRGAHSRWTASAVRVVLGVIRDTGASSYEVLAQSCLVLGLLRRFLMKDDTGEEAAEAGEERHDMNSSGYSGAVLLWPFLDGRAPEPPVLLAPRSQLPPGWQSDIDPKSGRVYYLHRATRKSQWQCPENCIATQSEALDKTAVADAISVALEGKDAETRAEWKEACATLLKGISTARFDEPLADGDRPKLLEPEPAVTDDANISRLAENFAAFGGPTGHYQAPTPDQDKEIQTDAPEPAAIAEDEKKKEDLGIWGQFRKDYIKPAIEWSEIKPALKDIDLGVDVDLSSDDGSKDGKKGDKKGKKDKDGSKDQKKDGKKGDKKSRSKSPEKDKKAKKDKESKEKKEKTEKKEKKSRSKTPDKEKTEKKEKKSRSKTPEKDKKGKKDKV